MTDTIITLNEQTLKNQLGELVRVSVEETLNKMLDAEAHWMWGTLESLRGHSGRYEPLRDVGDATLLYEKTWAEVKAGFAKEKARRAALPPPTVEKSPAPKPIKGKKWVSPF